MQAAKRPFKIVYTPQHWHLSSTIAFHYLIDRPVLKIVGMKLDIDNQNWMATTL